MRTQIFRRVVLSSDRCASGAYHNTFRSDETKLLKSEDNTALYIIDRPEKKSVAFSTKKYPHAGAVE